MEPLTAMPVNGIFYDFVDSDSDSDNVTRPRQMARYSGPKRGGKA